jgi:hypothetical protein
VGLKVVGLAVVGEDVMGLLVGEDVTGFSVGLGVTGLDVGVAVCRTMHCPFPYKVFQI